MRNKALFLCTKPALPYLDLPSLHLLFSLPLCRKWDSNNYFYLRFVLVCCLVQRG